MSILVERRNTAVDHKSNRPEPSGAIKCYHGSLISRTKLAERNKTGVSVTIPQIRDRVLTRY